MTTCTGIDVGFHAVKALASNGREARFPSEVGMHQEGVYSLEEAKRARMVIEMDGGREWSVGVTALRKYSRLRSVG